MVNAATGATIDSSPMAEWQVTQVEAFERSFSKLRPYEQAVLTAAIEKVLAALGVAVCATEWGKALGHGLYEFRIRKSLKTITEQFGPADDERLPPGSARPVLIRVFFTVYGDRVVLLLGVYDKGNDTSAKRQRREITRARQELEDFRRSSRRQ